MLPLAWFLVISVVMACVGVGIAVVAWLLASIFRSRRPQVIQKLSETLGRPAGTWLIAGFAVVIAVVTQVVLVWDRAAHSMVGPHTVGEAILAWVLWSCCLLASFGVPVGLASLTPHASRRPRWPIAEFIAVVIGIFLVFYLLFFVQGLPSGFSDNVVLLAYPPAAVGYAFAAKKIVAEVKAVA